VRNLKALLRTANVRLKKELKSILSSPFFSHHTIFSSLTFCNVDKELKSSSGAWDACVFLSHITRMVLEDTLQRIPAGSRTRRGTGRWED
jgi:hypothetical protein